MLTSERSGLPYFVAFNDCLNLFFTSNSFQTGYSSADFTLHVFTDVSTKAFGAVAFLTRGCQVTFIMAKNCVAPLKSLTLPKLEMLAAVVASRVVKFTIRRVHTKF